MGLELLQCWPFSNSYIRHCNGQTRSSVETANEHYRLNSNIYNLWGQGLIALTSWYTAKKKRQVDTLKTTDWLKVNIHNCFTSFSIMSIVAAILPASYNNFAVKWSLETVVPGKYVKSRTKNFWQPWPQSAKIKIESVLQLCVCVCVKLLPNVLLKVEGWPLQGARG